MSQSSSIAAALIIAFIVFITVRGQLPCYFNILGIATGGGCNVSGVAGAGAITLTGNVGGVGVTVGSGTGPGAGGVSFPGSGPTFGGGIGFATPTGVVNL